MSRKSQQNLRDARTYFNTDLTKDRNDKYKGHRIDSEMFKLGEDDVYKNNLQVIPDNMKDNFSYVSGFNYAKRQLNIQKDMYKMGQEYFINGRNLEDAHENYKKNVYFVQGFRDAMNIKLENDTTMKRSGR